MSFIDDLRTARSSPVAAVHEFKLDYLPGSGRVYAFMEGHDDIAFYTTFLLSYVAQLSSLRTYNCGNKRKVFEAQSLVAQNHAGVERVLFFVDKDLADVLGEPRPTDARMFETEHYAIENYLVCRDVFDRYCREFIRATGANFDLDMVLDRFDVGLAQFERLAMTVMAWIVVRRRAHDPPNLAGLRIGSLLTLSDDLTVSAKRCSRRLAHLERICGVASRSTDAAHTRAELRRLLKLPASHVVRGKFVAWFFIEFARRLLMQLHSAAAEIGGSVTVKTVLHADNFVEVLAARLSVPPKLKLFLDSHLAS